MPIARKARLEERAQERARQKSERRQEEAADHESKGEKLKKYHKDLDPTPKAKEHENFTDPDSRIMKDGASKGFIQAYNAQIAVDGTA